MGRDKASLRIDGSTLAERSARLLSSVADLTVEVGEGVSELISVLEEPRGEGPLAAIIAGHRELIRIGLDLSAPCLVLACDLPLLDAWVLEKIANWPGDQSVLPVIDNIAQPLCARWSPRDLKHAIEAYDRHERSLRSLPDRNHAVLAGEKFWEGRDIAFHDVDAPEDLLKLNLVRDDHT